MPNSKFKIPFAARTLTNPITPIAPITPQFKIQNSKFRIPAACAQFTIQNSLPVPFVPFVPLVLQVPRWRELVARAQFKIHNSEFKIPTRIIGLKNSFLYGG